MNPPAKPSSTSLFQVFLRLRPPTTTADDNALYPVLPAPEGYLTIEGPNTDDETDLLTHITINPPLESRRRAIEKFAFTKVFQEDASQLDIFDGTGVVPLLDGVLAANGRGGRDALVATLGVTGSGKTHTILGSRSQRGLTQLTLDVLFRSLEGNTSLESSSHFVDSLARTDASEAHILSAAAFLDGHYGDSQSERGGSRAPTPMTDYSGASSFCRKHFPQRPSALPQVPDVSDIRLQVDDGAEYAVLVSMYEVYNDRIFDLLTSQATSAMSRGMAGKDLRRRPLLFKSTEHSPDRKMVAGLRKILCSNAEEALMILETGLVERRVAGTGSNLVSSRSHGFFCIEVKKRPRTGANQWTGSMMTIVDLAGSERARNANTAGATLAEAGKINESLMYLGQCLQLQSDTREGNKAAIVPFRQCKLTELLFSNSFSPTPASRNPQKAIMIVTADPRGDFNATSQILRYSALAREVTVPRVPSVSSTILSGALGKASTASGRTTPSSVTAEELEAASQELARLSEDLDIAHVRLAEEEHRRERAEMAWQAAEEKCARVESETREECWAEMERRMEAERGRWKGAWDEAVSSYSPEVDGPGRLTINQANRNDEVLDHKVDLIARSFHIHEDPPSTSTPHTTALSTLETENTALRTRLVRLERDLHTRSPTKPSSAARRQLYADRLGIPARKLPEPPTKHEPTRRVALDEENEDPEDSVLASMRNLSLHPAPSSPLSLSLSSSPSLGLTEHDSPNTPPRKAAGKMKIGMELRAPAKTPAKKTPAKMSAAGGGKTPGTVTGTGRKVRKLTTRKWDLGDEGLLGDD
ncbi:MAG: hypothetical protein M1833_001529 [Piccolia ochrophora]|nr:MAG: hypothetical protein M1833_001529 [Piccolia ochrophora]